MKKKRVILIVVLIVVIVIAAGAVFAMSYVKSKLDKVQTVELVPEEIEVNEIKEEVVEAEKGYTTIAFFGLDNRNLDTLDKGLSDVIIVLSINKDTEEMEMVSVYRDTYLNTNPKGGDSYMKCNAAYSYGGAERAISMLNTNLDLDIDNYVTVNFQTVADAINVLGGVDIDIKTADELKWLNFYIDHTNEVMHTNVGHIEGVGIHTLNGVQSVAYGRIRYTSGGDYSRAERHRTVLTQMYEKAKKADPATLNLLLDVVLPEVQTDLSSSEILGMLKDFLGFDLTASRGFPFEKTTTMHASAGSIVVPCDLETNVRELHAYLYGNDDYEPSDQVVEYSNAIINRTGLTAASAVSDAYENVDGFTEEEIIIEDEGDIDTSGADITEEDLDDGYVE